MTNKQSSWLTEHIAAPIYNAAYAPRDAAKAVSDAATNKETGDYVMRAALGGLGLGLSGTRLYHLIQSLNKPKDTHTKFGPGAKTLDENEKVAAAADKPDTSSLVAALQQLYNNAALGVGKTISAVHPSMSVPATLGAAGLGFYGGMSAINSVENARRKEEQKELVEDAKQDYQRALMGRKYAAEFETAHIKCSKAPMNLRDAAAGVGTVMQAPFNFLSFAGHRMGVGDALAAIYATGTLGAGAAAGKMTYDWTRHRSRDKALERARKSRARIEGAAPLYVDPEQLAAIKRLAD